MRLVPEDQDATAVVVALRLDVGIGEQEDGENDRDDVPAGENEPGVSYKYRIGGEQTTDVNVSATVPI